MTRTRRLTFAGTLLALATLVAIVPVARAAGTVVVAAAPSHVTVGDRVEVLIRTFLPFSVSSVNLDVPAPATAGYPVASGYWSVLYPWPDYPFHVVATGPNGEIGVTVARDPADATLFRGVFSPDASGEWTIQVTNFEPNIPGSRTTIIVDGVGSTAGPLPSSASPDSTSVAQSRFIPGVFLAGAVFGLAAALITWIALRSRRRPGVARRA